MNLQDRILELLKGRSQHKPLLFDDIYAKTGADKADINAAIDDLQGRGALNRAEITRGDRTFTALWPTGLVPRALSWKDERNNGVGLMGANVAHNVQQDAERSRQTVKREAAAPLVTRRVAAQEKRQQPGSIHVSRTATPLHVSPNPITEDQPMTRVSRPPQIVEKVDPAKLVETPHASNRPRNTGINGGAVQSAVLTVLEAGGVLDVDTIYSRLTVPTTNGSVGKILGTLAKRGLIEATIKFHNKRHRRFYCIPGAAGPACSEPLCSELPGNLATLRKIGADDNGTVPAQIKGKLERAHRKAEDETARRGAFDAGPLGGGDIHAPDEPISRAANALDLDGSAKARWALWDNGMLMITSGDDVIALPRAETERLAEFLHGSAGVVFAPEPRT